MFAAGSRSAAKQLFAKPATGGSLRLATQSGAGTGNSRQPPPTPTRLLPTGAPASTAAPASTQRDSLASRVLPGATAVVDAPPEAALTSGTAAAAARSAEKEAEAVVVAEREVAAATGAKVAAAAGGAKVVTSAAVISAASPSGVPVPAELRSGDQASELAGELASPVEAAPPTPTVPRAPGSGQLGRACNAAPPTSAPSFGLVGASDTPTESLTPEIGSGSVTVGARDASLIAPRLVDAPAGSPPTVPSLVPSPAPPPVPPSVSEFKSSPRIKARSPLVPRAVAPGSLTESGASSLAGSAYATGVSSSPISRAKSTNLSAMPPLILNPAQADATPARAAYSAAYPSSFGAPATAAAASSGFDSSSDDDTPYVPSPVRSSPRSKALAAFASAGSKEVVDRNEQQGRATPSQPASPSITGLPGPAARSAPVSTSSLLGGAG